MRARVPLSIICVIGLVACAPAGQGEPPETPAEDPQPVEDDIQAIATVADAFVAAAIAGDVDTMVATYTDDASLMPPEMPAAEGSDAIRAWFEAFFEQMTIETFTLDAAAVEVAGDWAYRRGSFEMTAVPVGGGEAVLDAGKFVEIWRRGDDGAWRMAVDIWNSDQPTPAM